MVSKQSAHSTLLPVGFRTWLWCCTCLLLISMLWSKQAVFESKGDQLSYSADCRIRTQGLRHQIASRLNAHWQTDKSLLYMHSYHKQTDPVIHRHTQLNPITCTFLPLNIATEILKYVIRGMRYLSKWDDIVSGWRLHSLLSINGIIPAKRCLVSVLRIGVSLTMV